jgi:16S rRNA (guanine527-N7)-methyltransferase
MMEDLIRAGLTALNLTLPSPDVPKKLSEYGRLLLEKNQVMNLTAITDPALVAELHFLDSAAVLGAADFRGKRVIDVGTGAGFPGLPLRLLEPTMRLTLLDSLGKRVNWLREVCVALGAEDVECLHQRAEEQALKPGYREGYDLAVSRALAELRLLCELCLPYVKVGGRFLALKSVGSDEELSAAAAGIRLLGGKVLSPYDYSIPGTDIIHRVVLVEKVSPTPNGYPRRWAKIQKSPL